MIITDSEQINHIILGKGEVAKCIAENLHGSITLKDKGEWEKDLEFNKLTIFHICIPYNDNFVDIVKHLIKQIDKNIVIIHSTVKDGTCDKIGYANTIYSPVTGRHQDDFANSVRQFEKFFACRRELYDIVAPQFTLKTSYWGDNLAELEYSKIMSTSYMYLNLIYEKVLWNECIDKGYDHKKVYKRWNRNYNTGYKLHHPEWMRPVYDHVDDKTAGGHCLRPNIHLTDNKVNDFIKRWEE